MQVHPYAETRTRDAALAAAPYGMFICTADGTFDSVNAAFEKLTGFTPDLTPPEDSPMFPARPLLG